MKRPRRRWIREAVAVSIWFYAAISIFILDLNSYLSAHLVPEFRWVVAYRIVVAMVILVIAWMSLGHRRFLTSLAYVVAYPGIFLLLRILQPTVRQLLKRWAVVLLFSPVLYSVVLRARSTFALYTAAICCSLLIVAQGRPALLYGAMAGLGIFLIVHLYRSFIKAYSAPVFGQLTKFARTLRNGVEAGTVDGLSSVSGQANSQAKDGNSSPHLHLSNLYTFHSVADLVADRIQMLIKRRVIDLYLIGSWFYTVVVALLVYAFEYWAAYKVSSSGFINAENAGFWNFAGFSFGTLSSASVSHIEPSGPLTTLLTYSEVACGLLILVILVFTILTAAREAYREDVLEFTAELRMTCAAVEKRVLDVYELTVVQLEQVLVEKNYALVNLLRKARGLPEISAAKETQVIAGTK